MSTSLSALLRGASATGLGIGSQEKTGYIQYPDPGPPYTKGGTVPFKLKKRGMETRTQQRTSRNRNSQTPNQPTTSLEDRLTQLASWLKPTDEQLQASLKKH